MATAGFLQCRHIFGVSSGITDNVAFIDDDTILYVTGTYHRIKSTAVSSQQLGLSSNSLDSYFYVSYLGQTIVLHNEKSKRQRFIQGPEITDGITACAVGSGKR
jgi:hypothetical protein